MCIYHVLLIDKVIQNNLQTKLKANFITASKSI